MKKLLIILMLFTSSAFAQETVDEKPITNVEISEAERLVDKYTDKVSAAISALAESLAVPAEHVYKILVKQQVVKAVTWSIFLILFLLFELWVVWIVTIHKDKDGKTNLDEFWGFPVILGIALLTFLFFTLDIITGGFINPEYGAIKDVMELIK